MSILSISSILPVPGLATANDFVVQTYTHYLKRYPEEQVIIIRPVRINLNPLTMFRKGDTLNRIRKLRSYELKGFRVEVLPFISAWRARNLHAFVSRTLFRFNRRRLDRIHNNCRFDIIHAQFILPDGMLAERLSRRWGIPFVVTTHNEKFYFDHAFSRNSSERILRRASAVLPINHFNYSYFKSIGIPGMTLIPIGFDRRFVKDQKTQSGNPVSILSVCELISLKNIDKVIEAIAILSERHNVQYTVAGRGPRREALEEQVASLGLKERVSFLGAVPYEEIDREMYRHDIFIMPSYFETFGRVYLEAMAMGIPIICARNSGIYGLFKDQEEGLAVDHTSVPAIAEALEALITDEQKRKEMGSNGKKLVEQYTWENVIKSLAAIYAEATGSITAG